MAEIIKEGVIVKAQILDTGKIRVQCPVDLSEHFLDPGTKEFTCPIDGTLLRIQNGRET